jgi:hypothetical protein
MAARGDLLEGLDAVITQHFKVRRAMGARIDRRDKLDLTASLTASPGDSLRHLETR